MAKKLTNAVARIRIEHIKHLLKPGVSSITRSVKGGYGDRTMFVCPTCQKTCAVLYGEHPQCRRCSKLNYACQSEDAMHRLEVGLRKQFWKISNEIPHFWLDAPNPYSLPRPKGMHRKTYNAICDRILRMREQYAKVFLARLERSMLAFRK